MPPQQAEGTQKSVKFRGEDSQASKTSSKKNSGIMISHSKNHDQCFRRAKSYKRGDFEKAALKYVDKQLHIIREESRGGGDFTPALGDVGGSSGLP